MGNLLNRYCIFIFLRMVFYYHP